MAFTRNPDFFASLCTEGRRAQVIVAEDPVGGSLSGLCLRTEKEAFVDGRPATIGYLGGLRLRPGADSLEVLRRGAAMARRWHDAGSARLYLRTVTEGNDRAAALIASGRLGLPRFRDLGGLRTYLLRPEVGARLTARLPADRGYTIRRGRPDDLPAVVEFLRSGACRQFYPVYAVEDFHPDRGLLRGLSPEDLFLAHQGPDLIGVVGLWDQDGFKQSRVAGYSAAWSRLRPLWNLYARLASRPGLPPASRVLRHRKLACIRIAGDSLPVFRRLLGAVLEAARPSGDPVAVMVHERDPLRPVLDALPALIYGSRLAAGCYEDGRDALDGLDERVPYVELGAL